MTQRKELLKIGAKLELCGELDAAAEVYRRYVEEGARLSDGTDALCLLYGEEAYSQPITSYRRAAECAFIGECAKKLIELMRGNFPDVGPFETPTGMKRPDAAVVAFFEWLTKRRSIGVDDYKTLKKAKNAFAKSGKLSIEATPSVSRRTLEEVVCDLVCGATKVVDKRLR